MINDSDDRCIRRWLGGVERERRFSASYEEHVFADAGPYRIGGNESTADWFA